MRGKQREIAQKEHRQCDYRDRDWSGVPQAPWEPLEATRGRIGFPPEPPEVEGATSTSIQTLGLQNTDKINYCCFLSYPKVLEIVYSSHGNEYKREANVS